MRDLPDGPGLYGFEARQSDDEVKRDLELIHVVCGKHLCDIEPEDTLGVLVSVAEDHLRECSAPDPCTEPDLYREARGWIADCFDDVDVAELTDAEVRAGIQRHYEGGWAAFVRASTT